MDMIDNMQDKIKEMVNDPYKKEHLEQMAKEKGINVEEEAKEHLSKIKDA